MGTSRRKPPADAAASSAPTPKVAAAGALGVPLSLVIVWLAGQLGLDMSAEVGGAIGALIAAGVGYLKSNAGYLQP